MTRSKLGALGLCTAVWLVPASRAADAQTLTSASVTGTVHDASGAVIPGATVDIVNLRTNQAQQAVTDPRGRFRLVYLPVGDYALTVQLAGFGSTRTALTLKVGDQIDLPIVLQAATVTEAVQVEAAAPLVEARRTEVSAAVSPQEVDTLPLNGRNYLDLALLAPNVSRTNLRTTDRFAETSAVAGTAVSISGQRNLANSFIVDGLSANDDAADLAGTFFSEEVVREFQVVTSGGVAEFGRASGGTVSVVTKSGSNTLTARAYEFFRGDMFDARNPLSTRRDGSTNAPLKDPLRQNQYGLSIGGPIAKDRAFGFGSFERTQLDRTGIVTIAPAAVIAINRVLDEDGYPGPRVTTGNYPTGYTTNNLFGRVDDQVTPRSHLQVRYSLYNVGSHNARNVGALNDVSRGAALNDTDQTVATSFLSTLSSGMINEARAQYTRSDLAAPVNDVIGPAVNVSGVASWGTATFSPTARVLDVVQAVDTVTFQRGDHLVKAGGDLLYNRVRIDFPGALQGVYAFTSLANFGRGTYSTFQQAFGEPSQFQSNPNLGLFVQDEWRVRHDLTVNAGIRYDLQWLPQPVLVDANNISPRLGVGVRPRGREDRLARERRPVLRSDSAPRDVQRLAAGRQQVSGGAALVRSARRPGLACHATVVSSERARVSHDDQSRHPGWTVRTGRDRNRACHRTWHLGQRRVQPSARTPDHHVPQRQCANADRGRSQRHGHSKSRAAEPRLRQHQPVRFDRRFVVRRADGVDADAVGSVGPRARLVHVLEVARRRGQCILPDTAGQRERPRRQGAVGQRSTSPRRIERHVRRRNQHGDPSCAPRHADRLPLRVRERAAVQPAGGRRSQQRHDHQRSAARDGSQLRQDAVLGRERSQPDVRNDDARPPIVADAELRLPAAGRGDGGGVQHLQPHERGQHQQQLRPWDDAVGHV